MNVIVILFFVQFLLQSIFPVSLMSFISHTESHSIDTMTQGLNVEMSERKRKSHFYFCKSLCCVKSFQCRVDSVNWNANVIGWCGEGGAGPVLLIQWVSHGWQWGGSSDGSQLRTGVLSDPRGDPSLHDCLRPHHRCCGKKQQQQQRLSKHEDNKLLPPALIDRKQLLR